MSRASVAVMVLSVAGLGAWVGGARAQQCVDDTGCPKGFDCQVTGISSTCSGGAPTPGCAPGQNCDLPAMPIPMPTCTSEEYRSCVPSECMSDSDCASGMVCHAQETDCASTRPAPDDAVCKDGICPPREPPPPTECKVKHQCIPRYLLPCEQASDCGAGFTCEAQKRCGCSGSGTGGAGADPGAAPTPEDGQADRELPADAGAPADFRAPVPPPDCVCEVTPEKYCKAVEVVCKADSDCPGDFTCKVTETSASGSGGAGGAAAAGPCNPVPGADGGCAQPAPLPVVPPVVVEQRRCVPPYDGVAVDLGGGSQGEAGRGGVPTSAGDAKGGVEQTPNAPPSALPDGDSASRHASSCSARGAGTHGTGSLALWASLLTLAAAMLLTRRRK